MDKILGIIFLCATIVIGFVFNGKIALDKSWTMVILAIQMASWAGYISLLNIHKHYKISLTVLSMCAFCIIGFFYILKV